MSPIGGWQLYLILPYGRNRESISEKYVEIINCCSVKDISIRFVLAVCESGCPQRRIFEVEKKLLLDFEFFIGD